MSELSNFLTADAYTRFVSIIGVLLALLSALWSVWSAYRQYRNREKKLTATADTEFQLALSSSDILVLGRYLDEKLGRFTIHECATSTSVAVRVDAVLDRIRKFVGTADEMRKTLDPKPPRKLEPIHPGLTPELDRVQMELETGETWNALARLRRHIEMTLRDLASERGVSEKQFRSTGQLLRILRERDLVNPDATEMLGFSVNVCNHAIHGQEIPYDQAREAVQAAAKGFNILLHPIE